MMRNYLNDLQFIRHERAKDKITNITFGLFVDGYIERLIFAINKSCNAKQFKPDVQQIIFQTLLKDKKLQCFNF